MRAFGAISAAIGKILKIFSSLQRIKNANENIDCGISYAARKLKLFYKLKTESESAQAPFSIMLPNFLNLKLSEKIWTLKIF